MEDKCTYLVRSSTYDANNWEYQCTGKYHSREQAEAAYREICNNLPEHIIELIQVITMNKVLDIKYPTKNERSRQTS
jgi:hypothetical protein